MWFVRLLLVGALVFFAWRVVRYLLGAGRNRRFRCATCRSCGKLFDDGVLCRFQGRETFKNETHIRNCIDYQPR